MLSEMEGKQAHKLIAVMGGTFDPVHNGHLRSALELCQLLNLAEVRMLPCHQPTHRSRPGASSEQRLEMLELAIAGEEALVIDDREILADQPSYSVYTLESMHNEHGPETSLCWVMGIDAFASFSRWHQWERILELANLVVLTRPGYQLSPGSVEEQIWQARHIRPEQLSLQLAGGIVPVSLPSQLEISATYIRQLLFRGQSARYLLPQCVLDYAQAHALYRR